MARANYLNNRDMLFEIHKSKASYTELSDNKYNMCDIIIENFDPLKKNMPDDYVRKNINDLINDGYESSITSDDGSVEIEWIPGTI